MDNPGQSFDGNASTPFVPRFCTSCGASLIPGAPFCPSCGNKVNLEPMTVQQPAVEQFAAAPVAPAVEQPVAEQPTIEAPAAEVPAIEQPTIETPAVEAPTAETPAIETPAVETPAIETPTIETPAAEAPTVEQPVIEPAAAEPPSAAPAADETPADQPLSQEELLAGIAAAMAANAASSDEAAAADAAPAAPAADATPAPEPAPVPEQAAVSAPEPAFAPAYAPAPEPAQASTETGGIDPAAVAAFMGTGSADQPAAAPSPYAAAAATSEPTPTAFPSPDAPDGSTPAEPAAEKPKKKIKPWMFIVGGVVLVGIIVAVVFAVMSANRAQDYENANELYDQGKYAEAAEIYGRLGDYEDSQDKLGRANRWVEAEAAESAAGEDPAAWMKAAEAYEKLGTEASDKVTDCENTANYYTGVQLMAKGDWAGADAAFDAITVYGFKDADSLANECDAHAKYEQADKLYKDGKYYEAYSLFNVIGENDYEGISDAPDRAKACIQPAPEAGTVARGDAFTGEDVELTIKNSVDENVYYKLYIDGNFVVSCFVPASGEATITLPSGTYSMNKAYGSDWFGPEDMFGDAGEYYQCNFDGSTTVDLEPNGIYEISAGGSGAGIGSTSTDRGSF